MVNKIEISKKSYRYYQIKLLIKINKNEMDINDLSLFQK